MEPIVDKDLRYRLIELEHRLKETEEKTLDALALVQEIMLHVSFE